MGTKPSRTRLASSFAEPRLTLYFLMLANMILPLRSVPQELLCHCLGETVRCSIARLKAATQPDQIGAAGTPLSAMAARPPGRCLYRVEGLHPICRAIWAAVISPEDNIALAAVILMASRAGGRPPTRPRARLA